MGTIYPFDSDISFEEHIKHLKQDELLDIWVEAQQLEEALRTHNELNLSIDSDYEKIILRELQLRSAHA